jgi:hypothetical protein
MRITSLEIEALSGGKGREDDYKHRSMKLTGYLHYDDWTPPVRMVGNVSMSRSMDGVGRIHLSSGTQENEYELTKVTPFPVVGFFVSVPSDLALERLEQLILATMHVEKREIWLSLLADYSSMQIKTMFDLLKTDPADPISIPVSAFHFGMKAGHVTAEYF